MERAGLQDLDLQWKCSPKGRHWLIKSGGDQRGQEAYSRSHHLSSKEAWGFRGSKAGIQRMAMRNFWKLVLPFSPVHSLFL